MDKMNPAERKELIEQLRARVGLWVWIRWIYVLSPLYLPAIQYFIIRQPGFPLWIFGLILAVWTIENWKNGKDRLLLDLLLEKCESDSGTA
jgi:hypothetical protein